MAEDTEMGTGTGQANPADGSTDGAQPAKTEGDFFLGTYRTREDAERGLSEKDKTVSRAFAERDKLSAKVDELTQSLTRLAEARASSSEPAKPKVDRTALAKEIDDRGGDAVLDIVDRVARDLDEAYEKRLSETRKEYDARIAELDRRVKNSDPEYVQHREDIQRIAEAAGLDPDTHRDLLLKIVRASNRNGQPDRPTIPGNTATPVYGRPPQQASLASETIQTLESSEVIGKLRPEEIKAIANIRADTVERRRVERMAVR